MHWGEDPRCDQGLGADSPIIHDAIAFHLEGLAADAQPQPPVRSSVATVLV
ncbi:hypothetical protein [Cyanobium sp. NS01]|uniref:hypothetical protein n=1 Tax=Cyanobium sp. NS01 TaxID=261284 RepID=UPI001645A06A|nr:hypothetical protein [Cyanobium sp. NS01]QNI71214.1 hypothetical protein CyaNS01_02089 [Cyanobium sp. NS01]